MSGRSSETRRDPVICRTPVRLVRERAYLSVVTDLRYDRADPYAVTILFNADAGPGMAVEWRFGRELLLAGREGFDRDNDFGAYDRIRLGMVAVVDDTVQEILGRPARTFTQFATDSFATASRP